MSSTTKRNFYISYLKGVAILGIMAIHLIDWSTIELSEPQKLWKELLYPSVLFFIALAGSVVYIAYAHKDDMRKITWRLLRRGGELIGIYFLYNLIKLFVFDFSKEPFYWQFTEKHTFDWLNILQLHSFSVPITIIFTIGVYLLLSPLLILLTKKTKYPKATILVLILFLYSSNYFLPHLPGPIGDFLYSQGYVIFPILLWLIPYLIGYLLAMIGFEKHRAPLLLLFAALASCSLGILLTQNQSWLLTGHMYPIESYYIFFSFFWMYILVYIFSWLERVKHPIMHYLLAILRVLGDSTLSLYVFHWIVIDLTIWFFAPQYKLIWLTVGVLWIIFLVFKSRKIGEYAKEYLE